MVLDLGRAFGKGQALVSRRKRNCMLPLSELTDHRRGIFDVSAEGKWPFCIAAAKDKVVTRLATLERGLNFVAEPAALDTISTTRDIEVRVEGRRAGL